MRKTYCVYTLANKKNGTLYIGGTGDLIKRVYEHKHKIHKGFSANYDINKLVYFEQTDDIQIAISREKQLKKWNRTWKIRLIEEMNPFWNDLYYKFGGDEYEKNVNLGLQQDFFLDSRPARK